MSKQRNISKTSSTMPVQYPPSQKTSSPAATPLVQSKASEQVNTGQTPQAKNSHLYRQVIKINEKLSKHNLEITYEKSSQHLVKLIHKDSRQSICEFSAKRLLKWRPINQLVGLIIDKRA